jgi:hypothetical protein
VFGAIFGGGGGGGGTGPKNESINEIFLINNFAFLYKIYKILTK